MPPEELSALLASHPGVRTAFFTDGAGRFTQQIGTTSTDDVAADIDVLCGAMRAFSARRLGTAKVAILTSDDGVIVARLSEDVAGGVLGVIADDTAPLGLLIRYISHGSRPSVDGAEL